MDDILMTLADPCHNKDCSQAFHIRHIWVQDDGTYTECDSDGNHDEIDAEDVPTFEEHDASWRAYAQHVVDTGDDCLGEYMVKRTVDRKERWSFKFNRSILGVVLVAARRGRTDVPHAQLPPHVREYLNLRPKGAPVLQDFKNWAEFEATVEGVKQGRWHRVEIEHKAPRNPVTVDRELRAIARRALRRS